MRGEDGVEIPRSGRWRSQISSTHFGVPTAEPHEHYVWRVLKVASLSDSDGFKKRRSGIAGEHVSTCRAIGARSRLAFTGSRIAPMCDRQYSRSDS